MWSFHFLLVQLAFYTGLSFLVYCRHNIFGDFGNYTSWRLDQRPLRRRMPLGIWSKTPFALISNRASHVRLLFVVQRFHQLLTAVLAQFSHPWSLDLSNSVVTFLIWSCLRVMKPPFLQDKTCCTSLRVPQTHLGGSRDNEYLNNILRLLVVTLITILMHPFLGVCSSILAFQPTKNTLLHLIFVYLV